MTLPGEHPRFRPVFENENLAEVAAERIIRDKSGQPRAVFEAMRLQSSYLCGDDKQVKGFESLAEAASRILTDVPEIHAHEFADDIVDLFQRPRGGVRYVFGDLPQQPKHFGANGWAAGVLVFEHGVLIDLPIGESPPSVGHWLVLLHRLSWRRIPNSPLIGSRLAWHDNTTVPFDWGVKKEFDSEFPTQWRERFSQISTTSYYSVLGERERPLDVFLASAFAIQLLLSSSSTVRFRF